MNEDTSASSGQVRQAGPIVVGVDGSDSSRRALQWAVEEGAAHGNSVLAIRTYSIPALATADPGFVLQPVDIQEPVSYTHLDVYKRQATPRSPPSS